MNVYLRFVSLSDREMVQVIEIISSRDSGAPFQYKDHLSRYGVYLYKDKTLGSTYYFYNGNPYIGKTASI